MSLARSGDLICDICGSIIIKVSEYSDGRKGQPQKSICKECLRSQEMLPPETD